MERIGMRLVVSGDVAELYAYEKPYLRGYTVEQGGGVGRAGIASEDEREQNREVTLARARKAVRRAVNANRGRDTKFVTLTFAENVVDLDVANALFNKFIKRLKYRAGVFRWLVAPEFQRRGAVHYHLVIFGMGYLPAKILADTWRHGFVKINRCGEDVDNLGAYVSKYLTKGTEHEDKLRGRRSWWGSRNLWQSEEITDPGEIENRLGGRSPGYVAEFESEHLGKVRYEQYSMKQSNSEAHYVCVWG